VTVDAVLDPSAMVAWARGSAAMGELLALAAEEQRHLVLPAVALAEAFRTAPDRTAAMLRLLAGHVRTATAPLDPVDIEPVGVAARAVPLGVAHAVVMTSRTGAYLVTASVRSLGGLLTDDVVIEI
jgi:hypothetical protein